MMQRNNTTTATTACTGKQTAAILTVGAAVLVVFLLSLFLWAVWRDDKNDQPLLNAQIAVGNEIYVQHDADNNDVYALQKASTGLTTVYQVLFVEFTANKAWTQTGEYVDNTNKAWHGATAPDNYLPVQAGEEYFFRIYGVGITDGLYYTPVLFMDDANKVVGDALFATFSASKNGVVVTVPERATKMHITMYNNQKFAVQKVLHLDSTAFDALPVFDPTALTNTLAENYATYQQDRTVYQALDTCRVTFVIDDVRDTVDTFADLFIAKQIPLVVATIPEALIENASSGQETRLQVVRRVVKAGGEVIAHNDGVLTEDGLSDYNTLYSFFVRTKQMFNYYDFDVNGIILAGGVGQIGNNAITEEWASSFYKYSDLYGVQYAKEEIALDSVYYHPRIGLNTYQNNLTRIQKAIDQGIANKSWLVFYFHDKNDINADLLSQVLDYVNNKSAAELQVVTYQQMYDQSATKESEIINHKQTYYVAANGTSTKGTSMYAPMSYATAQSKTFISGDTILFRSGDTFYGTFAPKIAQVDDAITMIGAYGNGALPTIAGYLRADSATAWQAYQSGIWRFSLTNTLGLGTDIGFLQTLDGVKYYRKQSSLSALQNAYDFYSDGTYLYLKADANPYQLLGTLQLATKTNLVVLCSNLAVTNLRLTGTGAHGMVASNVDTVNVTISNNIIEDIGGCYLSGTTRYGNGIEFYATNASNILVQDNLIRNVYDVGFTMQGNQGSAQQVIVQNNVFVANSQDSEIWGGGAATGVASYEFRNNLSLNCGRGWGYDARPDQYAAAHILFWAYQIENTNIYFHDNHVYNPRRVYFIEQTSGTNLWFQNYDYIRADYNTYDLADDAKIFRDTYTVAEQDTFVAAYHKDQHSTFNAITPDQSLINLALTSTDLNAIRRQF